MMLNFNNSPQADPLYTIGGGEAMHDPGLDLNEIPFFNGCFMTVFKLSPFTGQDKPEFLLFMLMGLKGVLRESGPDNKMFDSHLGII